jgi:hypothetical protein
MALRHCWLVHLADKAAADKAVADKVAAAAADRAAADKAAARPRQTQRTRRRQTRPQETWRRPTQNTPRPTPQKRRWNPNAHGKKRHRQRPTPHFSYAAAESRISFIYGLICGPILLGLGGLVVLLMRTIAIQARSVVGAAESPRRILAARWPFSQKARASGVAHRDSAIEAAPC